MRLAVGDRKFDGVLEDVLTSKISAGRKFDQQESYPMHEINHTPPQSMTPAQRRFEVASLLARGLARLRTANPSQSANIVKSSDVSLAFSAHQRVHSDPVNYR